MRTAKSRTRKGEKKLVLPGSSANRVCRWLLSCAQCARASWVSTGFLGTRSNQAQHGSRHANKSKIRVTGRRFEPWRPHSASSRSRRMRRPPAVHERAVAAPIATCREVRRKKAKGTRLGACSPMPRRVRSHKEGAHFSLLNPARPRHSSDERFRNTPLSPRGWVVKSRVRCRRARAHDVRMR